MNYFIIALAGVSVGLGVAAHGQVSSLAASGEPVHPGTAILDSMGIDAGRSQGTAQAAGGRQIHPGTAILDSMGIFAGEPVAPSAVDGDTRAASSVKPN